MTCASVNSSLANSTSYEYCFPKLPIDIDFEVYILYYYELDVLNLKNKILFTSSSFVGGLSKVHKHNTTQNVVYIPEYFGMGLHTSSSRQRLCALWPFVCLCVVMLWCNWIPIHT